MTPTPPPAEQRERGGNAEHRQRRGLMVSSGNKFESESVLFEM
jgi:hypothetical protein